MWRRQAKDDEQERDPDPDEVRRSWDEWEARWNPGEEERVAHWLRMKSTGGAARNGCTDTTPEQMEWAAFEAHSGQDAWPGREIGSRGPATSPDIVKAQLAALYDEYDEVAAALAAERSELADLAQRRRQIAADLEAERLEFERRRGDLAAELEAHVADLAEQRRCLAAAVQSDQAEAERLSRHQTETRQMLEAEVATLAAEVASLQGRRREIVEGMEAAVARTERARDAELAAVAHLAEVEEVAKRVEREQFEIWVALDAEVTALRDHLHGGTTANGT